MIWHTKKLEEQLQLAIKERRLMEALLAEVEDEHAEAISKMELLEGEVNCWSLCEFKIWCHVQFAASYAYLEKSYTILHAFENIYILNYDLEKSFLWYFFRWLADVCKRSLSWKWPLITITIEMHYKFIDTCLCLSYRLVRIHFLASFLIDEYLNKNYKFCTSWVLMMTFHLLYLIIKCRHC